MGSGFPAGRTSRSRAMTVSLRKVRRLSLVTRRLSGKAPGKLSAGLTKTFQSARRGALGLKRRYEFLVEGYNLWTKCETMLKRAPELSAKGRALVARLELARRGSMVRRATGRLASRLATGLQTLQRRFGAE